MSYRNPGWQDNAACARNPDLAELFFAPDGEREPARDIREKKAKEVCGGCLAKVDCREYALERPEKYGMWGGENENERASERRIRMRRAAARVRAAA
ncbi:WhiB family transcriptional regulator [Nonomuraea sp. NPDC059023]|uniref:WhiB family transcriptional regulator n=1 Tax=unclassified Nonomuraea TaxID=2593643 RepID=UPI0036801184